MWLHEFLETILVLQPLCNHSAKRQIPFEFGAFWCLQILNHLATLQGLYLSSSMLRPTIESPWTQEQLERTWKTFGGGMKLFISL